MIPLMPKLITIPATLILLIVNIFMIGGFVYGLSTNFCSTFGDQICYDLENNKIIADYPLTNNSKIIFIADKESLDCEIDANFVVLENVCSKETIKDFLLMNKGKDIKLSIPIIESPISLVAKKSFFSILKGLGVFFWKRWFMVLFTALSAWAIKF